MATEALKCDLCNIFVNNAAIMESHVNGKKHRRAQQKQNENLEKPGNI